MVTGSEKQIKWYEKIADEVEKQAVSLVRAEMEKKQQ